MIGIPLNPMPHQFVSDARQPLMCFFYKRCEQSFRHTMYKWKMKNIFVDQHWPQEGGASMYALLTNQEACDVALPLLSCNQGFNITLTGYRDVWGVDGQRLVAAKLSQG